MFTLPLLFNVDKNVDAIIEETHQPVSDVKTIIKHYHIAQMKAFATGAIYAAPIGIAVAISIVLLNRETTDTTESPED